MKSATELARENLRKGETYEQNERYKNELADLQHLLLNTQATLLALREKEVNGIYWPARNELIEAYLETERQLHRQIIELRKALK